MTRCEVIRCDKCYKSNDVEYALPKDWVEIQKRDGFGNDESMHFCSLQCLVEWASNQLSNETSLNAIVGKKGQS